MKKKAICVYSTSRSGSTFIGALLANVRDAIHLGEVYAWFRPFRKHHSTYGCSCGDPECACLQGMKDRVSEHGLYQHILHHYEKSYLVDSSKDVCWFFDRLRDSEGIDFYNVVVWKSPKS